MLRCQSAIFRGPSAGYGTRRSLAEIRPAGGWLSTPPRSGPTAASRVGSDPAVQWAGSANEHPCTDELLYPTASFWAVFSHSRPEHVRRERSPKAKVERAVPRAVVPRVELLAAVKRAQRAETPEPAELRALLAPAELPRPAVQAEMPALVERAAAPRPAVQAELRAQAERAEAPALRARAERAAAPRPAVQAEMPALAEAGAEHSFTPTHSPISASSAHLGASTTRSPTANSPSTAPTRSSACRKETIRTGSPSKRPLSCRRPRPVTSASKSDSTRSQPPITTARGSSCGSPSPSS